MEAMLQTDMKKKIRSEYTKQEMELGSNSYDRG